MPDRKALRHDQYPDLLALDPALDARLHDAVRIVGDNWYTILKQRLCMDRRPPGRLLSLVIAYC